VLGLKVEQVKFENPFSPNRARPMYACRALFSIVSAMGSSIGARGYRVSLPIGILLTVLTVANDVSSLFQSPSRHFIMLDMVKARSYAYRDTF